MSEQPTEERQVVVVRRLRLTDRTCAQCGRAFMGWGRARFCSEVCKKRADYAKHAAERREKRRSRYARQRQERREENGEGGR